MDNNNNSYRYSNRNYKDSYTYKPGWEVKVCSQTPCAFSHLGNKIIKLVKSISINTLKFENILFGVIHAKPSGMISLIVHIILLTFIISQMKIKC